MTKNNWYDNKEVIEKLKKEFLKAGLPLEYKAKRIFENYGFEASESYYKYPDDHNFDEFIDKKNGIWRQIDIISTPKDDSKDIVLKFDNFRIVLALDFMAECKYSSKKSFFLFKSEHNHISNFPSNIFGENLIPINLSIYDSDNKEQLIKYNNSTKFYNFNVYENMVEVDISKMEKKGNNFDDSITYEACEQLFFANNYKIQVAKSELKVDLSSAIFESKLFKKWLFYLEKNNLKKGEIISWRNKIEDSTSIKFLKKHFDIDDIDNIKSHMIFSTFPIIIVNEESGIFEVKLDKNNNINGFEKIKYGLYEHSSKRSSSRNREIYPNKFGIIICDVSYLNELIEVVLDSYKKMGDELKKNIDEIPYLLGYEFLFNSEISNPNDFFM